MDFISLIDGIVIPNADIDLQDYEDKEGIDLNLSHVGLVKKDEKIGNFLTLIKSVKFTNADFTFIDIQDEGEEDRINLNFSVSALIKKNQTIANISQYIENIKIKNADFIFANDSDELIIDSEIEAIDLKNTENFEISVNDISLRLFLKRTEKGGLRGYTCPDGYILNKDQCVKKTLECASPQEITNTTTTYEYNESATTKI